MENALLIDPRFTVLCGMLFMTIVSATAEEPAAVPEVFQRLWRSYQIFQMTKKEPAGSGREKFWEIDMTKFEP